MKKQEPRKGARRMADIPPAILKQLNRGEIEAITLAEVLAVDMAQLLKNAFPDIDAALVKQMQAAKDLGWIERTRIAGDLLYKGFGKKALKKAMGHSSDQARGWGAAAIRAMPGLAIEERLELVIPFADDPNPGVRETAWIMIRPFIGEDLKSSIKALKPWVRHPSANIRRYASEITRPRGVWCAHLPALRDDPAPGLPLLEPLIIDPSRYVQNSVANWMNDASKDHPKWVIKTCKEWQKISDTKETTYICHRALRTLRKQAE